MRLPEEYRKMGVPVSDGEIGGGAFSIPFRGRDLHVIASNGMDWDHVSVSLPNRCPNWEEMSHIKSLFWDEEECVMQLHPPKSQYVNHFAHCLHLWRPHKESIPMPPLMMV